MRAIRTSTVLVALALLASPSVGQESETPPPQQQPAPAPEQPAGATPPAPSAETPPPPARSAASDDEFIPTQELQADEEATFPVDI